MLYLLIGLFWLSSSSARISVPPDEEPDAYLPAVEWSDTFDWKLLKEFSKNNNQNVLISPIGLKLALALLYEGSGGLTEKEFQNILQFPVDKKNFREHYEKILQALQPSERSQYILNLASRVFLDSKIEPQQQFASKAHVSYRTDIEPANFSNSYDASHTINSWIEKITNGKVSRMVSPDDLQDTIMLIANAIYFKGTWRHQFPKNTTYTNGFYISPSKVISVDYMTTIDTFYYSESIDLDAKILRLPYKGQNYALFIVLPNSKTGLSNLIKRINLYNLKKQLHLMDKVPVQVCIPKFKFNFQARFMNFLQNLGLTQMFENTASFPGIARGLKDLLRMLVVSDIVQKTGIEIDEEGSVVYAATEVTIGNKFAEVDYFFNASHPFMFFLEEQNSGTVLFVGKVENPQESAAIPLPPRFGEEVSSGEAPDLQPTNPERNAITRRFNYFDLELLKEFNTYPGNFFISPASIKTTLALLLEGARGRTAKEISAVLRIPETEISDPQIREVLERLLFDLSDETTGTTLQASIAAFVGQHFNLVPNFERRVKKFYKGDIQKVNFADTSGASKAINNWAANATHGLINSLVGQLPADTGLVLANALYFKGKWITEFNPNNTKEKCFYSVSRGCVKTQIMELPHTFNYSFNEDLNAHAVELPYQDEKYAMLLLIPNTDNNVKTLANDMQHAQFNHVIDGLRLTDLILELPKFEMEFETDFIQILQKFQVLDVFGSRADLSGIVEKEPLHVSSMIHKTRIEVNEQGTKAAAATAAVVVPLIGSSQRIIADHPFIFFIYHKASRNIIFEGVFAEPHIKTERSLYDYNQSRYGFSRRY